MKSTLHYNKLKARVNSPGFPFKKVLYLDNLFLNDLAESYITDRNLKNKDEIFNYLVNTRNYIRENELEIYTEIQYEMDKLNQQRLLYSVLDSQFISEDFGLATIGVVSVLLFLLHSLFDSFDHTLAKLFSSLQKIHNGIRTDLKNSDFNKLSKQHAERYQIVEKMLDDSYSNCSKMCGVPNLNNISKENVTNYMRALFEPNTEYKFLNPRHEREANCLVSCYLDYITSAIAELTLLYKQCLQKTGESVPKSDVDILKIIAPVGSKCSELRKDVNDLRGEFDDFLKHLYKNNPRLYSEWVSILNSKIDNAMSNKKPINYAPMYLFDSYPVSRQNLGL